jgi:hypothetical protein
VPGGEPGSLPEQGGFLSRLPSGQDAQESCPAQSLSFSRRKIQPQSGQRCRRDRPLRKLLGATTALIQGRRGKRLPSAYNERSPSLDPRMDAA